MRLFILLSLISFHAMSSIWSELEVGQHYKLKQSFQLKQTERSSSILEISQGDAVELKEIIPLAIPGFSMLLYHFDYKKCPGPQMTTEMEIVPVEGTYPIVKTGVFVEECLLKVYIETRYYQFFSLFE